MTLHRLFSALISALALTTGASAGPAPGTIVFSDLCSKGNGAFSGSRLTLRRASGGDGGEFQWGDTPAVTAPLEQLKIAPDGSIAFRYMPDADNPEVYIHISGTIAGDVFSGTADGKPLRIPRSPDADSAIPRCR